MVSVWFLWGAGKVLVKFLQGSRKLPVGFLRKTLGVHSSTLHSSGITGARYRTRRFVLGADREKFRETPRTGANHRSGDDDRKI